MDEKLKNSFLNFRNSILDFAKGEKVNPIIYGLAIGLYPVLYYYNTNFSLVNSWSQLGMFVLTFIMVPIIAGYLIKMIVGKYSEIRLFKFLLPVFNVAYFLLLLVLCTYGIKLKILALAGIIGVVLGIILSKHLNKIVIFQLLLALIILPNLLRFVFYQINYSTEWTQQPDTIEQTEFVKKPNVYVIQPDGYPNFSELKRGYYKYDNQAFEDYLQEMGFKLYNNFRSNYFSTLSSNSSMFSMKHHYYNHPHSTESEMLNARDIIVGANAVVRTFNDNGYKTNLLLGKPYLLVNRPTLGYDFCNIKQNEVSFLARGFGIHKNVLDDLEPLIQEKKEEPKFYFIEESLPSHITTYKELSNGKEKEREHHLERLQRANEWLEEVLNMIKKYDSEALIVIIADHGGFVGFDYTLECKIKQTDPNLIKSIFTTALAIKWPKGEAPEFDNQLKTNVNLFRILIAYLSQDETLLNNLQEDKSYAVLNSGTPFGVYEYINEADETVFYQYEEAK